MSVGRICNRDVVVASPDEGLREAVRRMMQYKVGTLVVVNDERLPIGILSDRDVALRCVSRELDTREATVAETMTKTVRTVGEETPIEEALSIMASLGVRRLPVVGDDGRLVGILALDDVIALLSEEAEMIGRLLEKYAPDIPAA